MSAHTPGPWKLERTNNCSPGFFVRMADGGERRPGYLAEVRACFDIPEVNANARLIAAAPEMLIALRRAVLALAFAAESSDAMRDDYEAVSAAIAKATGVEP